MKEDKQRLREFGMREPKSKNEVRVKLEESLGPTVWRRNGELGSLNVARGDC